MTVTLLVMTDGRRDCIARTIPAALERLHGPITAKVIHDDSADPAYRAWLTEQFSEFTVIGGQQRRGFGGAIRAAWEYVKPLEAEHVFHLEDDFVIARDVDLRAMIDTLAEKSYLVQLALLRNAVNAQERAAGGVIQQHPESYISARWREHAWREHRRFFTTNPSLYRRSLMFREWPDGRESEGRFGIALFAENPETRCAFWGAEGEWCEHIGHERVGNGY